MYQGSRPFLQTRMISKDAVVVRTRKRSGLETSFKDKTQPAKLSPVYAANDDPCSP